MTTLYYYGQLHGLLVAGTGNKIEDFGVGFFTKYGDGGVDISPIADLTKTRVRVGNRAGRIGRHSKAVPTDGLWDTERTDEEQMGASYPELEWAMSVYDSHKPEDFEGRQREVLAIIPDCTKPCSTKSIRFRFARFRKSCFKFEHQRPSENAGLRFSDGLYILFQ